jgi:hypothetical protein
MTQDTKDNIKDVCTAIVLGLALAVGALHYFDILFY